MFLPPMTVIRLREISFTSHADYHTTYGHYTRDVAEYATRHAGHWRDITPPLRITDYHAAVCDL